MNSKIKSRRETSIVNFLVILLSIFAVSCSNLSEEQEEYIGEWTYCGTNANESENFWDSFKNSKFILNSDGTWKYDKSSGQWGRKEEKSVGNELSLNFAESEIFAKNIDQVKYVEGFVVKLKGIDVLKISLTYTFQDWGTFDHSTEGLTTTPNKEYNDKVDYFFVLDASQKNKVSKFIKQLK